jgi:hypothetical protein
MLFSPPKGVFRMKAMTLLLNEEQKRLARRVLL